jgi:hemoglobin/transferrin/lactoferrin receptor protein
MKFNTMSATAHSRLLMAGASAAAILFAGTGAHAQQPYWLDGITILATKTEERAIDSLAAISTLRDRQLQEISANRPSQLFTGMPGVNAESSAQDPGTAINIRGLQDFGRVAVIIDGARQNFARAGHNGSGSFYVEPELLAEIDVSRGPVSNIYGSGAIGGVVSFRTKDADDILKPGETWGVATHGEVGTNGATGLGSIFGAVRAGPNADFVLGGTHRQLDDYSDGSGNKIVNSGQTVSTGLAKAAFRPMEGHEVKATGIYYDADWVNGTPGVSNVIRDSRAKNSTAVGQWSYSRPEDRLFNFNHSAYWNQVDVKTLATFVTPGFEGFYGNVGNRAGYTIDTIGYDGNNTSYFDTGPFRHALTIGGDIFEDDVSNRDEGGFGNGYNPNGKRRVWGAFAQLKSNYSTWLQFITALRYDNYSLSGTNAATGEQVGTSGDRISPKFTVGITPVEPITVYATYAEGYRAPAVTETLISAQHPGTPPFANFPFLPNPDLKPEVGKTKEIGINYKRDDMFVAGDRFRMKANVFRNDVDDFIDTATINISGAPGAPCPFVDNVPPPGPDYVFCTQYQNIAKARIEGVELESIYDRGDWFAGINAHRMRGTDMVEGDPLGNVPPDMVAATYGVRSADRKWTAALRWAHYGPKKRSNLPDFTGMGTDPEFANVTGSYNLVNLYLAYQPNENVIAALSVENLLDETYRVYTHEYNSPGITVKGSLRMRFAGGAAPLPEEKPIRR